MTQTMYSTFRNLYLIHHSFNSYIQNNLRKLDEVFTWEFYSFLDRRFYQASKFNPTAVALIIPCFLFQLWKFITICYLNRITNEK